MHDWVQTLTIIGTLVGVTAWLDYKHERSMEKMENSHEKAMDKIEKSIEKMDERWKWLFDWAHEEINKLKK